MVLALDTSVIVAALCDWHAAHTPAREALELHQEQASRIVLPAAALFESYSVLTRMPPPRRLSPRVALELLEKNLGFAQVAVLSEKSVWTLIRSSAAAGVASGAIHDRDIAETALQHGATALLTLNPRHFEGWEKMAILVPGPAD